MNENLIILEKLAHLEGALKALQSLVLDTPEKKESFKKMYLKNMETIMNDLKEYASSSLETKHPHLP